MKRHYFTLQIIYELAKLAKNPTSHSCHPSDIILRHNLPWDIVAEHLQQLKKEGLILMEHTGLPPQ